MKSFSEARKVLQEGLQISKKKYPLLNTLGEVEWKAGNIKEAVYWWAQCMHCQEPLSNYGSSIDAYLYLYYVAEGAGVSGFSPSVFLTMRVDQIRPGQMRLNASAGADLINLTRSANSTEIADVLGQLVNAYLVSKQKSIQKADPMEIDRLIRQLLGGATKEGIAAKIQLSDGNEKEQVQAARKLGELQGGYPSQYEPLMWAKRNTLSLQLQVDAEEAIEKIKVTNG